MTGRSTSTRLRLDRLLVEKGLAETRRIAQSLILSGAVLVNGQKVEKAGALVSETASVSIKKSALPFRGRRYVSRGGLKLEEAIDAFGFDPSHKVALDIGASTGGFTDCLLQKGAHRVYAVDVGYGQLAWRIRQDPRVIVLERTHILRMEPERLEEKPDLITIDVSFISLVKVLPRAVDLMKPNGDILALVKPQFEVGRGQVGKGGIVRDPQKREEAVRKICDVGENLGLKCLNILECSIHGQDGNVEFFLWFKKHE